MKKIAVAAVLVSLLCLAACAGTQTMGKSLSDDLGSPEKEALLKERATEFWSAFVNEDYDTIYALYDPFYRERTPKLQFLGTVGRIKYHETEVKDVSVEGNVAKVTVRVVYSLPKLRMKKKEFEVPETTTEFQERWLYVYDNWYKEYFLESVEAGVVKY
jgi:hypothetical protein